MSICLVTEVKRQWATQVLGWVSPVQCTTHVSDGFAARTSRPKTLSALFLFQTWFDTFTFTFSKNKTFHSLIMFSIG